MNPFSIWADMIEVGRMVGETLEASHSVIASRSGTIAAAARNPTEADHPELRRMIAEKSDAFARSGAALANDWTRLQSDMFAQAQAIGTMWLSGRIPTAVATRRIVERSGRIGTRALGSSARALRPIHATATANRRRLAKSR